MTALRRGKSYRWTLERRAASVLGRWGRPEDMGALANFRKRGTDHRLLSSALWASSRLANRAELGRERREARRSLIRDAERLLYDRHLRTRQTAVSVLGGHGNTRSIQELEALRARENNSSLVSAAEAAIERIRKRDDKAHDPNPAEVEARLKALEEKMEAAEAELKKLEERR